MKITECIDFVLDIVEMNKFVILLVVLIGGYIVFQEYQDYFTFIAKPEIVETFITNYLPQIQKNIFSTHIEFLDIDVNFYIMLFLCNRWFF